MLSDDRLNDIINDTQDALFVSQWLIAKAQWTRQKLERTRGRVYFVLEQSRADTEQRSAVRSETTAKAHLPHICRIE